MLVRSKMIACPLRADWRLRHSRCRVFSPHRTYASGVVFDTPLGMLSC